MAGRDDSTGHDGADRLVGLDLDESIGWVPSADVEHERKIAIYDLLQENSFALPGRNEGPYRLKLLIAGNRLIFDVSGSDGESCQIIGLALSPFRRFVKDYYMICESYFQAIKTSTPSQIETIDMARRGLHNDGSELLTARLKGKIDIDFNTARRLFTLVCVLHWRG